MRIEKTTQKRSNSVVYRRLRTETGAVLILAMVILVLVTLLAVYGAHVSTTELRIAANQRQAVEAFYAAESGIEEARARLLDLIRSAPRTINWRCFLGDERLAADREVAGQLSGYDPQQCVAADQPKIRSLVQIRFKTEKDAGLDPCGDELCSNDIVYWGDPTGEGVFRENPITCGAEPRGRPVVLIDSWGTADVSSFSGGRNANLDRLLEYLAPPVAMAGARRSIHHIRVELRWSPLPYALFADRLLDIGQSAYVQSVSGSALIAHVAANGDLWARNQSVIAGRADLGITDTGEQAQLHRTGSPGPSIQAGNRSVKRIAPDPLQIRNGLLAHTFAETKAQNSNLSEALPAITDEAIVLKDQPGSTRSMTLAPGKYFVHSIRLDPNTRLTINNQSQPVEIYLSGSIRIEAGAHLVTTGPCERFIIYCDSAETLNFSSTDPFSALIYAPDAPVFLDREVRLTGMIWAAEIYLKGGARVTYDPLIGNSLLAVVPQISWWKDEL